MAIIRELRFALRGLIHAPGFTLTAVGILAVGLGLTMFMFSALNAYVLKPLPFPNAEELLHVEFSRPSRGEFSLEVSRHDFVDLRREQKSLQPIAGFYMGTVNLGGDARPERFDGAFLSAGTFEALGVQPALGRTFQPREEEAGAPAVVILGNRIWRDRYSADPDTVGRVIRVNGREAEIVGVMPEGFRFPFNEDVWVPLTLDMRDLQRGEGIGLEVFGKIGPGVSVGQARGEFQAIVEQLAAAYPETNAGMGVVIKPYADEYVDDGARTSIITMLGAVVLVLLIACANVANLLIARNYARLREFSIRAALGAGRARIVLVIMAECLLISLVGAALGMWLAQWAGERTMEVVRTVENFAPPYWVVMEPDWRTWSFAILAALIAALAAGLSPALKASRMDLNASLREGGISVVGNSHGRLTRILVTAQITLSCVVLIGGGLMARSVISLANLDVGASIDGVMTGRIGLFPATYPEVSDRLSFLERLHERLEAIPQVEAATLSSSMPGTTTGYGEIRIEGITESEQRHFAQVIYIAPNYFEMFDIPALEGRPFWRTDRSGSQEVAIVNRQFADRYWPGESVIGRNLRIGAAESQSPDLKIVGVVPNVIQDSVDEPYRPAVYRPLAQNPPQFVSLALRSGGSPAELAEPMRRAVVELDRDLPVYWVRTLEDWIDLGRFRTNFLATLFGLFAVMGLLLGGIGQYGLLAYNVSLRAREIGVRRALGAMDKAVIGLLMRQSLGQLIIGLTLGLAISLGTARLLAFLLFGVEPFDLLTFGLVAAVLVATTMLAAILPARRALAVDPIVVLRSE